MKKTLAFILASLLCFGAAGALAADYTVNGLFTITYGDAFTLDDTTYLEESTGEDRWLFLLSEGSTDIDARTERVEGYEDVSLSSATEEQLEEYVNTFVNDYVDEDATLVGSLLAGKIPFYLFEMTDSDGKYYLAQTVEKGYGIVFYAYYTDGTDADEALLEKLEALVESFVPVQ